MPGDENAQGTFPLPIQSRRRERKPFADVKEKNLPYSLRTALYFPFFQPKKRATGQAMRGDLPQVAAKKYCDKSDTLKRGPADFKNRGEGAGRRHATTAQAGTGAVLKC